MKKIIIGVAALILTTSAIAFAATGKNRSACKEDCRCHCTAGCDKDCSESCGTCTCK